MNPSLSNQLMFEYVMTKVVREYCPCFRDDYVNYEGLHEDYDWNSLQDWMISNPKIGMCSGCRETIIHSLYVLLNRSCDYDSYRHVLDEMSKLWLHPGFGGRTVFGPLKEIFDTDSIGGWVEKRITRIFEVKSAIDSLLEPVTIEDDLGSEVFQVPIGTTLPTPTKEKIMDSWRWTDEEKKDDSYMQIVSDMYEMAIQESQPCT